uniref:hypothetical protein n=1 Tax=Candidatus Fimenecus sp. TaxID=3022888 RepID=UPI003FEFDC2C
VRIGVFHSPRFPKSRRQPAIGLKSTALGKSKGDLQVHKDAVRADVFHSPRFPASCGRKGAASGAKSTACQICDD